VAVTRRGFFSAIAAAVAAGVALPRARPIVIAAPANGWIVRAEDVRAQWGDGLDIRIVSQYDPLTDLRIARIDVVSLWPEPIAYDTRVQ
jgi:anaerobic selenocysteine-containing dehydrogenase